jgi:hypothetical protein
MSSQSDPPVTNPPAGTGLTGQQTPPATPDPNDDDAKFLERAKRLGLVPATPPPVNPNPGGEAEFAKVPKAEYEKLVAAQKQVDEANLARETAEREKLAKEGKVDELLKRLDEANAKTAREAAAQKDRYERSIRDREVMAALAGQKLRKGAAPLVAKLITEDFVAQEEAGSYVVRRRSDHASVADAVASILQGPEYAGFIEPTSQGGTGASGGSRPGDPPKPPQEPKTLGEALIHDFKQTAASGNGFAPVGLRGRG